MNRSPNHKRRQAPPLFLWAWCRSRQLSGFCLPEPTSLPGRSVFMPSIRLALLREKWRYITRMDNVLEGMRDNLEQHQTVLGNLLQQMEDAKVEVKRPFPQEAELAEKSERLAALNVALNIGGKDKPNSRERQKHDGKTSIKRLLRRMGVESAASAAPKKDKEMEVAI